MASGMKAPKAPKAPKVDPKKAGKKAGDKAKKKASKKAKAEGKRKLKKILLIVLPILLLAIVGLLVYLFMFSGPVPSETMQKAIDAAFIEDEEKFKEQFTPESVENLEDSWASAEFGVGRGSWQKMMRGILTQDELKPKIVGEEISEDGNTAKVFVDIDGVERTIHFEKIDEEWKINVNIEIDPAKLVLPEEDFSEEAIEEFAMQDPESELWWEEREAEEEAKENEEEGGCFCAVGRRAPAPAPLPFLLASGVLILWWYRRRFGVKKQRAGMNRPQSGIS